MANNLIGEDLANVPNCSQFEVEPNSNGRSKSVRYKSSFSMCHCGAISHLTCFTIGLGWVRYAMSTNRYINQCRFINNQVSNKRQSVQKKCENKSISGSLQRRESNEPAMELLPITQHIRLRWGSHMRAPNYAIKTVADGIAPNMS